MITTSLHFRLRPIVLAAAVSLFAVAAHAQTLLLHYTLDGNGTDTGSLGKNGALVGSAAYTTTSSGVGNFGEALSTANGTDDYLSAPTGGNAALGLSAMTLAFWVNIDSGANSDRLISNITTTSGFDLFLANYSAGTGAGGADAFRLTFGINGTAGGNTVVSDDAQYVSDKWLFIAVTYNSTSVKFYSGSETTGLVLNDTVAKTGSIVASASNLEIGGTPATTSDRSPTALFNDVRIYDAALSLSDLEAIRGGAVSIPEPSGYAMVFGAISLGFLALKGRKAPR